MTNEKFWIVWSPNGKTNPRVKHGDYFSARGEANRLCELNPNQEFYVMEVKAKRHKINQPAYDNWEV